jgi:anaerobic selenocysteine-containing dehydrogenase
LKDRVKGLAATRRGAVAGSADEGLADLEPGESVKANYKNDKDLWKQLNAGQCWYDAPTDPLASLDTASGMIELACQSLPLGPEQAVEDSLFLPHYRPLTPSGSPDQFPLQLVTYETVIVASGLEPNSPFMNKLVPDDLLLKNDMFVEIHPQTAAQLQLADGPKVMIQTPQGEAPARVRITRAARPGHVFMAHGFGHGYYDEYIRGKGVNANELVEVQMDPLTGLGTVWVTRAQLRRA